MGGVKPVIYGLDSSQVMKGKDVLEGFTSAPKDAGQYGGVKMRRHLAYHTIYARSGLGIAFDCSTCILSDVIM